MISTVYVVNTPIQSAWSEVTHIGFAQKHVNIGVIGYGAMGKAHAYGYTAAPVMRRLPVLPRLAIISGRNEAAVSAASLAYGFDSWTTDWRVVVERPDIDIVDICTPPGTHAELIKAASLNGKAVICEKPLAVSLSDAWESVEAVTKVKC